LGIYPFGLCAFFFGSINITMQQITTYIYNDLIPIQIVTDASVKTRNRTVYTRTINLYRGMDNQIKIQFRNQDQKIVNMTDQTVTFHLLNENDGTSWFSRTATAIDLVKGIFVIDIYETDLLDLDGDYYNYSINTENVNTGVRTLTYTDDNYSVRGQIHLMSGHYPEFHPSTVVALNNLYTPTPYSPGSTNITSVAPGDSTIPKKNGLHTAQFYFAPTGFSGSIDVEATLDVSPDFLNGNWFTVKTLNFTDQIPSTYTNWFGIHNFVRFKIIPSTGTITNILLRS
jgi:hypothetical protein